MNFFKNYIYILKIVFMLFNFEFLKFVVGFEGKYVDEFGNILDWDGFVFGCVEGDLLFMIGWLVLKSGEIFDVDGEVVGYVVENYIKFMLSVFGGGLKVDFLGNIYNVDNEIVGKLNDMFGGECLKFSGSGGSGSGSGFGDLVDKLFVMLGLLEIYLDVKFMYDGI